MDQQKGSSAKPKTKTLNFLPRASSSIAFQNPPLYSPAKDKRSSEKTHKYNLGIGFSGPLVSMAPANTCRKTKNNSTYMILYEPTSPRISCMGQVKHKHHKEKPHGGGAASTKPPTLVKPTKKVSRTTSFTPVATSKTHDSHKKASKIETTEVKSKNKNKLGLKKIFGGGSGERKSGGTNNIAKAPLYLDKAPSLSSMKRFASGRDALSDFDWTKEVATAESDRRSYYSNEEGGGRSDDEEAMVVPSSAPVVMRNKGNDEKFIRVGGVNLEPRKEINLWKRRTMPQPMPLQLHVI